MFPIVYSGRHLYLIHAFLNPTAAAQAIEGLVVCANRAPSGGNHAACAGSALYVLRGMRPGHAPDPTQRTLAALMCTLLGMLTKNNGVQASGGSADLMAWWASVDVCRETAAPLPEVSSSACIEVLCAQGLVQTMLDFVICELREVNFFWAWQFVFTGCAFVISLHVVL